MLFLKNSILRQRIFMKYQKYNLSYYHKYIFYIIGKSKNDEYKKLRILKYTKL